MVKIQTITHTPTASQPQTIRTPLAEHPFSKARQLQRAIVATKLEKMFAKPLLGALTGHSDGISCLAKCPTMVNKLISGAHDGQIKIWDISNRECLKSTFGHQNSVKGVAFSKDGNRLVSSSQQAINLYDFHDMLGYNDSQQPNSYSNSSLIQQQNQQEKRMLTPLTKYLSKHILGNIDHSYQQKQFATSGQIVQIWSYQRTKPIYKLEWNCDSIIKVKYNPAQPNILCGVSNDRSIILYDLRGQSPIQKIFLPNKSSCVSFNPIEPINFTAGNDDSNCYSFDIRKMEKAKTIHKDHIGAVIDIDYAPTGRSFVTGSFDKTLRIFGNQDGRSTQVYHTKRMQILSSVLYSMDAHYVLSGSQDMNIRIWKSQASKPVGVINQRQKRSLEYRSALIQKFKHNNQVRRINNHRHLPKYIKNAKKRRQDQNVSKFRKKINKEANTGIKEKQVPEKEKVVVGIEHQEDQEERFIKRGKRKKFGMESNSNTKKNRNRNRQEMEEQQPDYEAQD